jgi:hypothetical protein
LGERIIEAIKAGRARGSTTRRERRRTTGRARSVTSRVLELTRRAVATERFTSLILISADRTGFGLNGSVAFSIVAKRSFNAIGLTKVGLEGTGDTIDANFSAVKVRVGTRLTGLATDRVNLVLISGSGTVLAD